MASFLSSILKTTLQKGLSQPAKDRLLRVLAPMARTQFDTLAHLYAHAPHTEIGLQKLAKRGFQPKTIADVGAFHGDWSRMVHRIWPTAQKFIFEANSLKEERLRTLASEIGATFHLVLMGPEDGKEVSFFVMESGSSVLEENSQLQRKEETRQTARLDTLLAGQSIDFLKLDVQGFELEVLAGAPETLKTAQAVLLEVSLIAINDGAPIMSEVVAFMKQHGFEVLDILEIHHRPLDKATNQVDLLFVPATSPLLADKRH